MVRASIFRDLAKIAIFNPFSFSPSLPKQIGYPLCVSAFVDRITDVAAHTEDESLQMTWNDNCGCSSGSWMGAGCRVVWLVFWILILLKEAKVS